MPYSREVSKCKDAQQTGLATGAIANDDQLPVGAGKETTSVGGRDDSKKLTGGGAAIPYRLMTF